MRMFDPDLELVAVGSSSADMPTFGTWEETVLAGTIDLVDYLSCHIYFYNDGDLTKFLRSSTVLDRFLDEVDDTIQRTKAATGSTRDVRISLDEWNVWNYHAYDALKAERQFEVAPRLLEEEYTLADAVVVGTLLQSILNHADTVSIAALAQLVNVIGPIRAEPTGDAWRQTTFFPFAAAAHSSGHTVHATRVETPGTEESAVLATVTRSPGGELACVYLANRGLDRPVEVELDLSDHGADAFVHAELLWHPDPLATNTADDSARVTPQPLATTLESGTLRLTMPPLSWASIRVTCRTERG